MQPRATLDVCTNEKDSRLFSSERSFVSKEKLPFTPTVNDETVCRLFDGLISGQRAALASSITLVESQHPFKKSQAQELLNLVLKEAKKKHEIKKEKSLAFRIGLSGSPGVGKSTFIEALGKHLTNNGHYVAVLAVDPSSSTTGGSILGDKTRMPDLSRDKHAYIRPSPSNCAMGGVTRSTNEAIAICECAGYDVVLVETVGVGQSEYNVSYMVDMFVLLIAPGGGDELQGLKRGIIEMVDLVVVNKADGSLLPAARRIQSDYTSALKFLKRRSKVWRPKVLRVSSSKNEGFSNLWEEMLEFWEVSLEEGEVEAKRRRQHKKWMWDHIEDNLLSVFNSHPGVQSVLSDTERMVVEGTITPGQAADLLMSKFVSSQ